MPAGNTGDTGEHCSRGSPCPVPTHSITQHLGTLGRVPVSDPPRSRPRGGSGAGSAHPSGSCWEGSRHSVPGEAAATCTERRQCWASEQRGTWKCHPFAQLGNREALLASLCPSAYTLGGASGHGDRGHWWHHAGTLHVPPGQGDTHADLSTSCRIFFTESLMLKAMLLRMFLK